jgi:hypothetical protein
MTGAMIDRIGGAGAEIDALIDKHGWEIERADAERSAAHLSTRRYF